MDRIKHLLTSLKYFFILAIKISNEAKKLNNFQRNKYVDINLENAKGKHISSTVIKFIYARE